MSYQGVITEEQFERAKTMRRNGLSMRRIADTLGLKTCTVKGKFYREGGAGHYCPGYKMTPEDINDAYRGRKYG